jgi:hypothetical protein
VERLKIRVSPVLERLLPSPTPPPWFGRRLLNAWLADFQDHATQCQTCYGAVMKALAEDDLTGKIVAQNVCGDGAHWMRCLGLLKDVPEQLVISGA